MEAVSCAAFPVTADDANGEMEMKQGGVQGHVEAGRLVLV